MNIKVRSDSVKRFMNEFVAQQGTTVGPAVDDGKIAVVGHSMFFRVYTTEEVYWSTKFNLQTNNFYAGPDQCHTLMNCEVYPD